MRVQLGASNKKIISLAATAKSFPSTKGRPKPPSTAPLPPELLLVATELDGPTYPAAREVSSIRKATGRPQP
jgi:hypothetical protein